jgi:hypothetical protein
VATSGRYLELEHPEPPVSIKAKGIKNGVQIEWDDQNSTTYGFFVYRQNDQTHSMEQISDLINLDTSRHYQFLDTVAGLRGSEIYYYTVKTINDGYQESAFSDSVYARPQIATSIAMPSNFRLRKDGLSCYLFWADQSITEEDLKGYTIYRKRSDQDSFTIYIPLISRQSNHFHDTLISEGYGYEYQLMAVDFFGAESEMTSPISVSFPALLPAPPSMPQASVTEGGIALRWIEMRQSGLKSYTLYLYRPGTEPLKITSLNPDQSLFIDKAVREKELYFYYLTSKNEQGMESKPGKAVSVRY